ncbi:protein of unknown function [Candidatus Nitrosocaldus cavascurensis]|jgi:hypothetical protein|uniref:Uncharacterized protein n=1 Tax=Candidatus Nitrosocaldus cavascurensis TaxID=2058097 RepID=A0A2K5ARM2_9ARCH|nr:protein of unknown function [Candidatus Nitrosocaldus cavascurensis]
MAVIIIIITIISIPVVYGEEKIVLNGLAINHSI